ncbi:unnamed protein product [Cunninghamella echinulata]
MEKIGNIPLTSPTQSLESVTYSCFVPPRVDSISIQKSESGSSSPRGTPSLVDKVNINEDNDLDIKKRNSLSNISIDDPSRLLKVVGNIVKTRSGSVLSRHTILKMDHFPKAVNTKLEFHLQGAPNFRRLELQTYGSLNQHLHKQSCTWFLTREEPIVYLNGYPYVLREYANPMHNIGSFVGISSSRLEMVEERLKADVLRECQSLGGLLLVHQEIDDGTIVPCYIAADEVKTPKEVFLSFQEKGYRLKYFRIPISSMQAPEDNYFDEYVRVIKTLDPTDPLIFNCGMGGVRTTMGTILAQIIRRTQLLELGHSDPFPVSGYSYTSLEVTESLGPELIKGLQNADIKTLQDNVLLRLIYIIEQGLNPETSSRSAIEWAYGKGKIVEKLKEAVMGNYTAVASLTSVLEHGSYCKVLLDEIINRSDAVVNIRDDILLNRIRQTTFGSNDYRNDNSYLSKALAGLQRYMALLCFTSYINASPNTKFETRFSSWFKARVEVWRMVQHMRVKGPQLYFFRPVDDLRSMGNMESQIQSQGSLGHRQGMFEMIGAGAQSGRLTLDAEEFILKSRTGVVLTSQTILKIDFWRQDLLEDNIGTISLPHSPSVEDNEVFGSTGNGSDNNINHMHHSFFIHGASNFRHIQGTNINACAQPTIEGFRSVMKRLLHDHRAHNNKILWINLREEPIIYINSIPYVLRDRYFTLRNTRAYKGITGARLEQLEERLKEDVIREIKNSNSRILLHGEDREGNVIPLWEDVNPDDVKTVREVMEMVAADITGLNLNDIGEDTADNENSNDQQQKQQTCLEYRRLPVTAEKAPDWVDFDELRLLIGNSCSSNTSIVLNCQVGVGRSTMGTVMTTLVTKWLYNIPSINNISTYQQNKNNYQIINSLLRVIKNGLETKHIVDTVIDKCGAIVNLRDMIDNVYIQAEEETDDEKRKRILKTGVVALQRYFLLICFQAYLQDTSPDIAHDTETFVAWGKRHAEIATILQDLQFGVEKNIEKMTELFVPVSKSIGDGAALSDEVINVVKHRHGQVLAQQTILKHDAFPGCQKMSLREKIEGGYNFRRVEAKTAKRAARHNVIESIEGGLAADLKRPDMNILSPPFICGLAMPSTDSIKNTLTTMNAGIGGNRTVLWTCLREEPVLYVNKKPYVLRLYADPLKNLETTGIAKNRVESMEHRMKLDAIEEQKKYNGRLLLHDEIAKDDGGFELKAIWETAPVDCIQTPSEVFQSIVDEGYQVDYLRIPITDEQAPIPDVFDLLKHRVLEARKGKDILFNCQMGRGRTTTGMVTAALMSMILNNNCVIDENNLLVNDETYKPFESTSQLLFEQDKDDVYDERERYLNGEYKIILQLVSVLTYGKLAKRLTDQAINMCDHMQNLRKAIYDYRIRMESMEDRRSKKYLTTREVALNYLVRYFYLIVFADYLLEEAASPTCSIGHNDEYKYSNDDDDDEMKTKEIVTEDEANKLTTFKEWLDNRREIQNIIKLQAFELN